MIKPVSIFTNVPWLYNEHRYIYIQLYTCIHTYIHNIIHYTLKTYNYNTLYNNNYKQLHYCVKLF